MLPERHFTITSSDPEALVSVRYLSGGEELSVYRVSVRFPDVRTPKPVTVAWAEDMVNVLYTGKPCCAADHAMRQKWAANRSPSRFCFGAPLLYTVGRDGLNAETVAVSDPETPLTVEYYVDDFPQKYEVGYAVVFFDGMCNPIDRYEADIRIDRRKLPYYECVRSVYPWWTEYGYVIPPIPAAAEDPLYSSWYNFHQTPVADRLLRDLEIAADLGFRTVILDDGWQFEDKPRLGDYSKCGDWQVAQDKFPDFKGFVDSLHKRGLKLLVWFTVPFVGIECEAFERFRGKYLDSNPLGSGSLWQTLDPRYPEVRAFILGGYERFLRDYDIDGFKLDFIDSFRPGNLTQPYDPALMDCVTVDEAVKRLLTEIVDGLGRIKQDLLFEYRMNYVGPAVNRYGNMLRVGDCAYDALVNRMILVDLRLLNYPVAVHSDMLYWSREESPLLCARQLLNIFFSVPQISVILADSTGEQQAVLRRYLDYWTANRDVILHGDFRPHHPEMNYSDVTAEGDDKIITVLYADVPVAFTGKPCDVFACKEGDGVTLRNDAPVPLTAVLYDCFGNVTDMGTAAPGAFLRLPVTECGMAELRPAE